MAFWRKCLFKYSVSKIISRYNERRHVEKMPKNDLESDKWYMVVRTKEIPELAISARTIQRKLIEAKLWCTAKKPLIFDLNRHA